MLIKTYLRESLYENVTACEACTYWYLYTFVFLLFICFSCRKPIDNNNDSNPENIFENNTGNFEFSSYESLSSHQLLLINRPSMFSF